MKRVIYTLVNLLFIAFYLISIKGCASLPNIELNKEYDFSSKQVISLYIIPSGHNKLDDTYSRVIRLDLQSRGYNIINANKLLAKDSVFLFSTDHRQVADSLMTSKILPKSDIFLVVSLKWDSVYFATDYLVRTFGKRKLYSMSGMYVLRLLSEVAFYDPKVQKPILSFTASDTTHLYSDESEDELFYQEFPWMIAARQLTGELEAIPVCSIVNPFSATHKLNISFWVDNSYRDAFPNTWKDRLRRRILFANDILCLQFGIELVISEFVEWGSQFENSLVKALRKLKREEKSNHQLFRIGITLNKSLKTNWTDKSNIGLAVLGGDEAVITGQPSYPGLGFWNPLEEAITLAHEIGHMLGAVHVNYPSSIMYPTSGSLSYEFDQLNRNTIQENRNRLLSVDEQ